MIPLALLAPALLSTSALAAENSAPADSLLNDPDRGYAVSLHGELGALAVMKHSIQFSKEGSTIDYRAEGGQDVLFSFARLSADVDWGRHTVSLLYQPLDIQTEIILDRDLNIDGLTFPAETPANFRYGFPFYRGSYVYDLAEADDLLIAVGGSLQIRNATIVFETADGELRVVNRDVGPVPVLKFKARKDWDSGRWFGSEIDGFWAPIRYINGSNTDVEGAIIDASLRGGLRLGSGAETFLNVRYLAGGAVGTSDPYQFGDGFTENWLHFVTLSLGVSLR